ncbi:acyltransferase family protein [Bordetella sp. FB-8]|uniref:acyltransferase family protein n=1 Tax=Bordetella sp. FB-8 TaxID=1159870 RepID=UPI0003A2DE8E|nr:acyltransferase family protein [Bordetella sp. FB-8]
MVGARRLDGTHRSLTLKLPHWIYETLGWAGIVGLGYAILKINSGMPFPGKIALIPTLAAFSLVLSGRSTQTTASKILSLSPLVNIGLISYPLYLWHWPILVFMRYLNIKTTNTLPFIIFWMVILTLAYASYRWLEIPIRRKVWLTSQRSLLAGLTISFTVLAAFAVHVLITDGASYRFNGKERVFLTARIQSYTKRCDITARILDPTSPICKLRQEDGDQRKILLWGDSHASMLIPMLKKLANQNRASLYINVRNCPPFVVPGGCDANIIKEIIAKLQEKAINNIIFAYAWGHDTPEAEQSFVKTIRAVSQQGLNIWLMLDIPVGNELDPNNAIKRNPNNPHAGSISVAAYNEGSRLKQLAFFQRLKAQFPNIHIIDTSPAFCGQTHCWSGKGNEVWYRDGGHLNDAGGLRISSYFLPVF